MERKRKSQKGIETWGERGFDTMLKPPLLKERENPRRELKRDFCYYPPTSLLRIERKRKSQKGIETIQLMNLRSLISFGPLQKERENPRRELKPFTVGLSTTPIPHSIS